MIITVGVGAINGWLLFILMTAAAAELKENPLVDLRAMIPDAVLDVRYATADNFLKRPVYPRAVVYLRRGAAEKVAQAAAALRSKGLRLVLYDGYRPLSVQRRMWEIMPDSNYVANPSRGSRHNRGAAIDCGLADKDGMPLEMPSDFDAFGPAAHHDHAGGSAAARRNARLLRAAMENAGLRALRTEWWHYDDPQGKEWPLLDVPLEDLR